MKRNSIIDLTPLLDVILILLFAFMLNSNDIYQAQETSITNEVEKNDLLSTQLQKQSILLQELKDQNVELNINLDTAKEELSTLREEKNNWYDSLASQLPETQSENLSSDAITAANLNEHLQKYDAIRKKYFFVDVELRNDDGKIYINLEDTKVSILEEELKTASSKTAKKDSLKNLLSNYLEDRQGGYTFALISLKEDGRVRRAQYNLMWEVIKELQSELGSDKIFTTKLQ